MNDNPARRRPLGDVAGEVERVVRRGSRSEPPLTEEGFEPVRTDLVLSTGSTLLDLAIFGGRRRGGGVPGGILMEIFGPSGFGKTTLMSELVAAAQAKGGLGFIGDAEQRIKPDFAKMMGIRITEDNYRTPRSVREVEELIVETGEKGTDSECIDVIGIDSIASLTAELDDSKDGDKRGTARAKELHQMCRRVKGIVARRNRLVVFTNQIQDAQDGGFVKEKTPGGHAVPFYSSLRIRIGPAGGGYKIKNEATVRGVKQDRVIGIRSRCYVYKSSVDRPYREADISILFDYGIDDIRDCLEWLRESTKATSYDCLDREWKTLPKAIEYVESNDYHPQLRERVVDLWEEIEAKLTVERRPKVRW